MLNLLKQADKLNGKQLINLSTFQIKGEFLERILSHLFYSIPSKMRTFRHRI